MFAPAVGTVLSLPLPNDIFFFGETLQRKKHNVLTYDKVPKKHIALFGALHISEQTWLSYEDLWEWAEYFNIDCVPLIDQGILDLKGTDLLEMFKQYLNTESYLGGPNIEGIVIKNLHNDMMIGEQYVPFLTGKYVSEAFKEVHRKKSYGIGERKSKLEILSESYRNEARWHKALQHLKETNNDIKKLQTIGDLIARVKQDVSEECSEEIKDALWDIFKGEILRKATHGLPEWFKELLASGQLDE